jgi:hypothetical protein
MNLIAFVTSFDSFKIALKSIWPPLPNTLLRTSLYVRHLSRIWSTVCRPSPQSHPGSSTSGTLLFHKKSLSPIFSMRIWMSRALCHFFRPWCSRKTLCDGRGVCLNVVLPLVSTFQLFVHSALVCLLTQVFKVACKWYVLVCVTFSFPWLALASCLAALLAALFAASFPQMLVWASTYLISTRIPRSPWSLFMSCIALITIYALDLPIGF